jgi:dTMP kinase
MQEVSNFCTFVSQGLEPHLTLYLDIDPSIGLQRAMRARASHDRIEAEKISFHQKIREAYQLIQSEHFHRMHILDAEQSPELVLSQAMNWIEPLVRKHCA